MAGSQPAGLVRVNSSISSPELLLTICMPGEHMLINPYIQPYKTNTILVTTGSGRGEARSQGPSQLQSNFTS